VNNGDKPAYPNETTIGLTKRELMAKDFTAALLANPEMTNWKT